MTVVMSWPEHEEHCGGPRSDFRFYHPKIAKAMREQGMESFQNLFNRCAFILKMPEYKEAFGGVSLRRSIVHAMISRRSNSSRQNFSAGVDEYNDTAFLIGFALEKHPEDLFGLPAEKEESINVFFSETVGDTGGFKAPASRDPLVVEEFLGIVMEDLDETERYILTCRFGLDGGLTRTYEDIGEALGVKKQAVQQRFVNIMRRLGGSVNYDDVDSYVQDLELSVA